MFKFKDFQLFFAGALSQLIFLNEKKELLSKTWKKQTVANLQI
jgi:hypothetical protein